MKKYLFIVPSFASGGAERAVVNLSSQLARIGQDVTVIIYFSMPNEYEVDSKVKVINLSGGNEEKYNSLSYWGKIKMLRHILKSENPDFIFPFLPQVTIHSALAGFDMRDKIIHTIRNNPAVTPPSKVKRMLCNTIVCRSWKTIVQNEKQRAFYPAKYQQKMHVLFNPVSSELLQVKREYRKEIKSVIGVGRLDEQKNFGMLIRAMKQLHNKYPNLSARIYGEGQEREALQKLIEELGLQDVIFLMGRSNDMKSVYGTADLFVLPSNYEGMPNTLIEAMASGLPCIATDCETGPSDLIENEENGLLIPVKNKDALIEAMDYMVSNLDTAMILGEKARKTIHEKCTVEAIVSELQRICEE